MSADAVAPWEARSSRLSLIFKPGQRPAAADILGLRQPDNSQTSGFTVGNGGPQADGRLELLAAGLNFDLAGLAPAAAAPIPAIAHRYGFSLSPATERSEAITLSATDNPGADKQRLAMVRVMAGLAARLAALPQAQAVVWHPARTAMAPLTFITAINSWLRGGAFPALGLTALYRDDEGAIRSEGLAFFTGQELLIEPSLGINTAAIAKIGVRLINELVGTHAIDRALEFIGPDGEHFSVGPSGNDRILRVWRKF